jgi:DNA-binding response OmpR family regulator
MIMSESNVTEIGVGTAMAGRVIDRKIFETPVTILANLTAFEQTIFNRLTEGKGEIVSKDELCKALYPNGPSQNPNSNGVEVFVMRLRKKIGEHRITTMRGKGYILHADEPVTIEIAADQPSTAAAG